MNMRIPTPGICLLLCAGCAAATQAPPAIALITTDNNGGWLLFTDRPGIAETDKIYVLGTDLKPHVTCCARITGSATAPAGMGNFFGDALGRNPPATQHVFHVTVPADALLPDNPTAMAAWGVANVTVTAGGYSLHTASAKHYEADACFGSEGINIFMRTGPAGNPPIAHYYGAFGYDIGEGNCPE